MICSIRLISCYSTERFESLAMQLVTGGPELARSGLSSVTGDLYTLQNSKLFVLPRSENWICLFCKHFNGDTPKRAVMHHAHCVPVLVLLLLLFLLFVGNSCEGKTLTSTESNANWMVFVYKIRALCWDVLSAVKRLAGSFFVSTEDFFVVHTDQRQAFSALYSTRTHTWRSSAFILPSSTTTTTTTATATRNEGKKI